MLAKRTKTPVTDGKGPEMANGRTWRDGHEGNPAHLETEGWLTQAGRPSFPEEPRWDREIELSMVEGRLSVSDVVRAAFGRPAGRKDRVRHFRIIDLRLADYWCLSTPSRKNPRHSSVRAPFVHHDRDIHRGWWNGRDRAKLEALEREGA